jgi:hypothetical protein
VDVEFRDGSARRIHFFASRLKYSRWVRVSLVKDETVETLVRGLAQHLDSWGGAPLVCVFDRPETVALKWAEERRDGRSAPPPPPESQGFLPSWLFVVKNEGR